MTNIHLVFNEGKAVGSRLGDLDSGAFYKIHGRLYRVLSNPVAHNIVADTVTSVSMDQLEQHNHSVDLVVNPVVVNSIQIMVEME